MYIATHRVHIVIGPDKTVDAVFKNRKIAAQYVRLKPNAKDFTVITFKILNKAD